MWVFGVGGSKWCGLSALSRCFVTDVVLPDGSGPSLIDELRGDDKFPVVYTSGYAGDRLDSTELARQEVEFLGKPNRPAQLVFAIERVVETLRRRNPDPA